MRILVGATLTLMATACSESRTLTSRPFALELLAQNGDEPIRCDTMLSSLGSGRTQAKLKDFRFYISDLRLIGDAGQRFPIRLDPGPWQSERIALVDFLDRQDSCAGATKATHTLVTGQLAQEASGSRLEFTLGIPEEWNHIDSLGAPPPLDVASLFWSWLGGYKFMRLDFAPEGGLRRPDDPDFAATTFNFHLGSTDCTGLPEAGERVRCERPNRPLIRLDGIRPGLNRVRFDLSKLLAGMDVAIDVADTPGCMAALSDPECASLFEKLGLDATTGQVRPDADQLVFQVQP